MLSVLNGFCAAVIVVFLSVSCKSMYIYYPGESTSLLDSAIRGDSNGGGDRGEAARGDGGGDGGGMRVMRRRRDATKA